MADIKKLQAIANKLRIHSLNMTAASNSGHPTTCMSMAEIGACLFFDEMSMKVDDPHYPGNDELVLSKGHAAPILWAMYAEAGIITKESLLTLRKIDSNLEGHPTPRMPWIKAATGSLGQGLSVGVGMALAQRLQKTPARTYVIMGDGEIAEGSVWEAASIASVYKLNNLCAIADINGLAQSGRTMHDHDVEIYAKKFTAFGWHAITLDGHSVKELLAAFKEARNQSKPTILICKTMKGKGVSFLEDKEGFHGKAITGEKLEAALKEIGEPMDVNAAELVKAPPKVKAIDLKPTGKMARPKYKLGEMIATRVAYGKALAKLGDVDPRIVALDGDTKNSTFAQDFFDQHPDKSFECYIAEQNMVGMAVGFGTKGYIPFAATFAAFLSRAHDQIRMGIYSESNMKIVGSHVGVSIGADGASQMGLEDMGMMRSIPNGLVFYPSDAVSAEILTELMVEHDHIGYLRTTRAKTPVIYRIVLHVEH